MTSGGTLRWQAVQEYAEGMQREYPDWRWGQSLFNALWVLYPDLAEQIRGTESDPFHSDDRVPAFTSAVMEAR